MIGVGLGGACALNPIALTATVVNSTAIRFALISLAFRFSLFAFRYFFSSS
jgi:hypothetical protein